jgi:predicted transposase/invertase (TIGR01784 family)
VQNPHDRFFRRIFSDPENAAGELRTILPAEIVGRIDWSTLCLSKSTYVDDELSERRADVLLSASLGGRPVFLYLLLEHQSTSPALMAFRLLGYMVRIWEDWLGDNPNARRLPPIVAAVVHHSDQGWSAPLSMTELYDLDTDLLELLRRYLPSFEFRLDDLTQARDEELFARAMTTLGQVALFCLKRARTSASFDAELGRRDDALRRILAAKNGVEALSALWRYILEVSNTIPDNLRALARRLGPRAEEAFMTGEQILLERGRIQGEAKGRAEGEAKGRAEMLLKQLAVKFGPVSEDVSQRVRSASLEELERWVELVLTASSLEDVLRD